MDLLFRKLYSKYKSHLQSIFVAYSLWTYLSIISTFSFIILCPYSYLSLLIRASILLFLKFTHLPRYLFVYFSLSFFHFIRFHFFYLFTYALTSKLLLSSLSIYLSVYLSLSISISSIWGPLPTTFSQISLFIFSLALYF